MIGGQLVVGGELLVGGGIMAEAIKAEGASDEEKGEKERGSGRQTVAGDLSHSIPMQSGETGTFPRNFRGSFFKEVV